MSWSDGKKLSSRADIIGWNSFKKIIIIRTKKFIGLQDISLWMIASASRHEFRNGGLSFIQIHASGWVQA